MAFTDLTRLIPDKFLTIKWYGTGLGLGEGGGGSRVNIKGHV